MTLKSGNRINQLKFQFLKYKFCKSSWSTRQKYLRIILEDSVSN